MSYTKTNRESLSYGDHKGEENQAFESDEINSGKPQQKYDSTVSLNAQQEDTANREQWANPVEFLLSCIAMSVGLGNIWRFPFTAYENGGGAFLIPYIIVLVVIGKPLYYMELCMGQFSSFGSVKVWAMVPALKGIGYGQAIATWCVVTYYVSLMAVAVFYFVASFFPTLPWALCGDRPNCADHNTDPSLRTNKSKSPSEIYYEEEVLKRYPQGLDDGIFAPDWRLTLCLMMSWIILFIILAKGVKSAGKSAYFTALFPYVVLFILLIRGLTLPGAMDGIKFFIIPDFAKLLEPRVWFAAVGQSFFSLSVGFGSIIMFSSYNGFRHNVYRDATIISVTDTLTSLLAGVTIFGILGHLAKELGVPVSEVVKDGGSGLAFISYPDVIARFDVIPQLFAVLFFLMLFTLGVGSASALTGCIITIICDEFPLIARYLVTLVVCVVGFLLGLFYVTPQGQYILELVDYYGGTFVIYILALLEVVAVQWIYGMKNFIRDIEFMLGRKTGLYWRLCWGVLIPGFLFIILVYTFIYRTSLKVGSYVFGSGAIGFGNALTVLALSTVPIFLVLEYYRSYKTHKSISQALCTIFKPSTKWCPKESNLVNSYSEFIEERRKASTVEVSTYLNVSGEVKIKPWFLARLTCSSFGKLLKSLFWDD